MTLEDYRADERRRAARWEQLPPEQQAARSKFLMEAIDYGNGRPFQIRPDGRLEWLEDARPCPVPPPGWEHLATLVTPFCGVVE
jgi:hypothetical protein